MVFRTVHVLGSWINSDHLQITLARGREQQNKVYDGEQVVQRRTSTSWDQALSRPPSAQQVTRRSSIQLKSRRGCRFWRFGRSSFSLAWVTIRNNIVYPRHGNALEYIPVRCVDHLLCYLLRYAYRLFYAMVTSRDILSSPCRSRDLSTHGPRSV